MSRGERRPSGGSQPASPWSPPALSSRGRDCCANGLAAPIPASSVGSTIPNRPRSSAGRCARAEPPQELRLTTSRSALRDARCPMFCLMTFAIWMASPRSKAGSCRRRWRSFAFLRPNLFRAATIAPRSVPRLHTGARLGSYIRKEWLDFALPHPTFYPGKAPARGRNEEPAAVKAPARPLEGGLWNEPQRLL